MAGLELDLDSILADMAPKSQAMSAQVMREQGGTAAPKADVIDSADIVVTGKRPQPKGTVIEAPRAPDPDAPVSPNMFTEIPGQLDRNISDVQSQANTLGDVFATVSQGLQVIQDKKEGIASAVVGAKRTLNDQITTTNQEILSEVAPLFAQRQAIADRRAEVQNMNPLKRAIFGIFDRNYSDEYLSRSESVVDDQLASRGAEFEQMNALTQRLLSSTVSNFEDESNLLTLHGENLNQDLMLASTALQFSRAKLSDTTAQIGAKTELARSQILLADRELSSLDGSNLNAAIAASQKNGGKVMVNGAELSTAQLKARQMDLTRQNLALVAAQQSVTSGALSIQSQRMGIGRQAEQMLIDHMSFTETQDAIANNGKFKGRQLNQADLGLRMEALNRGNQAEAYARSGTRQALSSLDLAKGLAAQTGQLAKRATDVFGRNVPPELIAALRGNNDTVNQIGDTALAAKGPSAATQVASLGDVAMAKIKQTNDLIEKLAGRMSGDKDAQIGISAYLRGESLTGEQATRTVMAFAKGGGLPPGVKMGGAVAGAMAAGQRALQAVQKSDDYRKATAEGKQRLEAQAVSSAVGRNWTGATVNGITDQLPDLARQMGDDFGRRVSTADFRRAKAAGDAQGAERIASEFNKDHGTRFTSAQMGQLFGGDRNLLAQVNQGKPANQQVNGSALQQAQQAMIQYQTSAWMNNLDQIGGPGTQRAFARFIERSDVQGRIGQYADGIGRTGLGAMLADSIAPGGVRNAFGRASQHLSQMATANEVASLQNARQAVGQYASDPIMRANVIIGAMPGLTQHEKALASGVIKTAATGAGDMADFGASNPMAEGAGDFLIGKNDSVNRAVDQAITSTQYQDPALRKVMQKVAKSWQDQGRMIDNAIHTLSTGEHK
jgi:hypothetical protein